MAPVTSRRFCEPYPVTTTESRVEVRGLRMAFITLLPEIETSCVWCSTKEKINVLPDWGTLITKVPETLVVTLVLAPFTDTVAPANASPLRLLTAPTITLSWADKKCIESTVNRKQVNTLFNLENFFDHLSMESFEAKHK